jgi:CheY-like chemotaxis protein/HPt (histidine-containing phosphotransfer) domain-containing protein
VRVSLSASPLPDGRYEVLFAVADTGIGIPNEELDRLFVDFHQLDGSLTRKHGGTGLGLAISRRLTELMGGKIWAESTPGQGSTFYFTLVGEAATCGLPQPAAPLQPPDGRPDPGLRILVAEDHPVNQQVMLGLLQHLGYRADLAANGLEVLEALKRQTYDLILMDVQMPEMDGLEATRRIRRLGDDCTPRIVAMTAHAMAGDRERCLEGGMDGYLSKPVQITDLAAELAATKPVSAAPGPAASEPLDLQVLDRLRELSLDGSNLLSEVVRTFATSSTSDLAALRRLTAEGRWCDVETTAHRLKGGSGCVGAVRVAAVCAAVEERVREARTDEVGPLLTRLGQELEAAGEALDRVVRGSV